MDDWLYFSRTIINPSETQENKKPSLEYTEPIRNFHVRILDLVEVKAS